MEDNSTRFLASSNNSKSRNTQFRLFGLKGLLTFGSFTVILLLLSAQGMFAFSSAASIRSPVGSLTSNNSVDIIPQQFDVKNFNPDFSPSGYTTTPNKSLTKEQSIALGSTSLPFIENRGQTDEKVKFYANTFAGTVFVTSDGLTYALTKGPQSAQSNKYSPGITVDSEAIQEKFVGSQRLQIRGIDKSSSTVSFFTGSDKSNWQTGLSTYNSISLGQVWAGIS